jgi:hypothetical protein
MVMNTIFLAIHGECLIDVSSMTGKSLPIKRWVGDEVYCSSKCVQGEAEAIGSLTDIFNNMISFSFSSLIIVTNTGDQIFFGNACRLTSPGYLYELSPFQTIVVRINCLCIVCIFIFIIMEMLVM